MEDLLKVDEWPHGFSYPQDFVDAVESGIFDIGPWQILSGKWLRVRKSGLRERFPERHLVPFARRLDSDDVACWDLELQGTVCVVHDFSAPGWEKRQEYESFSAWHADAQAEADDYEV
jgi:hypothetical protein